MLPHNAPETHLCSRACCLLHRSITWRPGCGGGNPNRLIYPGAPGFACPSCLGMAITARIITHRPGSKPSSNKPVISSVSRSSCGGPGWWRSSTSIRPCRVRRWRRQAGVRCRSNAHLMRSGYRARRETSALVPGVVRPLQVIKPSRHGVLDGAVGVKGRVGANMDGGAKMHINACKWFWHAEGIPAFELPIAPG